MTDDLYTDTDGELEAAFQKIVEEENERIDNGHYRCPACGFEVGMILTASCNQCGHVPKGARA